MSTVEGSASIAMAALYAGIKPGAALMTDGYEPYNEVAHNNQLIHLGCWARARRYMIEAEEILPTAERGRDHPVGECIRLIGQLFAIESRCAHMTPADRVLVRQRERDSVLEQIEAQLLTQSSAVLPQSAFGKHCTTCRGNGRSSFDTSKVAHGRSRTIHVCENAIRPFAVGRKTGSSTTRSLARMRRPICIR